MKFVREQNREHAKKSRLRRKFMMDSLKDASALLKVENSKLKAALAKHFPTSVIEVKNDDPSLLAGDGIDGNCSLDNEDYDLVKALQTAQQNFVVTDPSLPDNPIVFASGGFMALTGYSVNEVLGKNCRFLQGPETDMRTVSKISDSMKRGEECMTVILNYRSDGSTFWNQLYVAPLRDGGGKIVNYLGVQCRVSDLYAISFFENDREGKKDV